LAEKSADPVAASVAVGSSAHDHTAPCRMHGRACVQGDGAEGVRTPQESEVVGAPCSWWALIASCL
jgi:hypothetical protein